MWEQILFLYRDEQISRIKELQELSIPEFNRVDKKQVEEDVREILGIRDEEEPVILNLESIRVLKPGKFEIDLVSLMNRRPIVFKLEEGKYIIDLESSVPDKKENN